MLWGSCQRSPPWTLPPGSARCHTLFQPTPGGGARARALARGEGGSRMPPQQVKSQVLFWGQQQLGPCGLRLALVQWTALPSRQPSPRTLCRLCLPLSAGGLPTSAASFCVLSVFHCSTRTLPGRGRVWGPTSWVGALLHTVGGVAWFFFLSLC